MENQTPIVNVNVWDVTKEVGYISSGILKKGYSCVQYAISMPIRITFNAHTLPTSIRKSEKAIKAKDVKGEEYYCMGIALGLLTYMLSGIATFLPTSKNSEAEGISQYAVPYFLASTATNLLSGAYEFGRYAKEKARERKSKNLENKLE